jgi:hypothetical protein
MARRWVKIWVAECLTGTIRFDFTPEERGVWYDLLLLAGNCRQEGLIAAGQGVPYPDTWIAGTLNIPLELLKGTIKKCIATERIEKNGTGYKIVNWEKYQSEYDRQKPYREAKKRDTDKYFSGQFGHNIQGKPETSTEKTGDE